MVSPPFARYRILTDAGCIYLFGPADACAEIVALLPADDVSEDPGCQTMMDAWFDSQEAANIDGSGCEAMSPRVWTHDVWWMAQRLHGAVVLH